MPVLSQGRYADACKTEAVRLVSESGRPVAQIARELGVPDHVRYRWMSGQRHAQAQGTRPESMCGCARNEIVYDGRRRAWRESLHEIPLDAPERYPCQDRTRSGVPPPSPIIGSPYLLSPVQEPGVSLDSSSPYLQGFGILTERPRKFCFLACALVTVTTATARIALAVGSTASPPASVVRVQRPV